MKERRSEGAKEWKKRFQGCAGIILLIIIVISLPRIIIIIIIIVTVIMIITLLIIVVIAIMIITIIITIAPRRNLRAVRPEAEELGERVGERHARLA